MIEIFSIVSDHTLRVYIAERIYYNLTYVAHNASLRLLQYKLIITTTAVATGIF